MQRTIDDLLELSPLSCGAAAMDMVPIAQVIDEARARAEAAAEHHHIKVTVVNSPVELHAVGSHRQLVSAVANLLENAVKYSDTGSEVVVESRLQDGWIEIVVTDTGVGIPIATSIASSAVLSRRPGAAATRAVPGWPIDSTRRRTNLVRSPCNREGEGSTFTMRAGGGVVPSRWCSWSRRAELRQALTIGLNREGFRVVSVTDGFEAVQRFDDVAPDIVLLDVMLPKLSGIDVCRQLRKRSHVPIIMVTAKGAEIDTVVGLEVGADDYITKPYRMREVVARMRLSATHAE